jgi:hypothetical protein
MSKRGQMKNMTFDEIEIGASATFSHTLSMTRPPSERFRSIGRTCSRWHASIHPSNEELRIARHTFSLWAVNETIVHAVHV